ncbi:MAG: class I SAM-dependent methyltransferase [Nocardioidaceae bacterium]
MHDPHDAHSVPHSAPHSAEHWDERYAGDQVWSGHVNEALVVETTDLTPGRALDVGCGEGADAVWLARQGWAVTALDISARAVDRTVAAAEAAGVEVDGVASGLLEADLAPSSFDLVSAMYPALPRTPARLAELSLLGLVRPGGTLLVVHHADIDREAALAHGCDPDDYVSPDDVAEVATRLGGWDVERHERRERTPPPGGAGAHHHADVVVRLRRG